MTQPLECGLDPVPARKPRRRKAAPGLQPCAAASPVAVSAIPACGPELAQALARVDADVLDTRTDEQVACALGVNLADLEGARTGAGYRDRVRACKDELFFRRDLKQLWHVLLEKARSGDAKLCERLLEEFFWLDPNRKRESAGGGAAVQVVIVNTLHGERPGA